jgi:AAA domain/TrwC relaxase
VTDTVTAVSGFDLEYPLKGAGERSAGGYFMNASQQGEPPGRWFGPGAEAIGMTGEVRKDDYRQVYGERPVNPQTGEPLGKARHDFGKMYQAKLAELMAAEPHATEQRIVQLEKIAAAQTRQSAVYTDVTVGFSKSISIFHGSIRENARQAREAGDEDAAAWWDEGEARFADILHKANLAGLEHMQRWAGVTRTGYHGRNVNGEQVGRWEDADLVVTSWLQGTSRAGDMHDHVHNAVLPKVRTKSDGKWRATDTMAVRNQLPAMQAIIAAHVEAGLAREFGVTWIARPDGAGNEIRGISESEITEYSSRRESVKAAQADLARKFEANYGRTPNQRELLILHREAWALTRPAKDNPALMTGEGKDARIDWDKAAQRWDAQLGGRLTQVALRVSNLRGPGCAHAARNPCAEPDPDAVARAVRTALACVQDKHAKWTRPQLMRQIGVALPAEAKGLDPAAAVAMVESLTDRALAGEFEQVESVSSSEVPALPGHLRREVDGRSVYTRPGAQWYCTRVQLSLEERLLNQAQAQTAPCLGRETAASQLGAQLRELESALRSRAARSAEPTGSGLRMDQAAALHHILTSAATADVLVGPAGSGKTRTLAEAAKVWASVTGGRVIGLATAQAARNVLETAGVELAQNTSQFLGHAPGQRGARGVRDLPAGSLIVLDEASMMTTADLADIIAYARLRGCKVIVAGDQEQLAAVEGGGGMMLLARRLGYVQLAEAVRFDQAWERDASLGLRRGELAALDEYDDQGRIIGDEPDRILDSARAAYVGHYLAGTDVLMIARAKETCRELSRRVRDDLIHLGIVDDSQEVTLSHGAKAGRGDTIVCKQNDHDLEAGRAGRTLANGDVLRVQAVHDGGSVTVVRRDGRDSEGGQAWSVPFRFADLKHAELGYAVTGHTAQGQTVSVGLAVALGNEGRQWFYTAMTRGAVLNMAYVATQPPRVADTDSGTAAAPELERRERIERERAGLPEENRKPAANPEPREARAVVADILERDDSQESALESLQNAEADADHLGRLDTIWQGETRAVRIERYRQALAEALPAGFPLADSPRATWLWRSLGHAEAAGLDPGEVIRQAVTDRELTGARDVIAVIDARVRARTGAMVPAAWRPWTQRVPKVADPVMSAFLHELAATMEDRMARLGEQAAESAPAWAVNAFGPVPDEPQLLAAWTQKVSYAAAYRELYGYEDEREPLGPEPVNSPEARSLWFTAYAAVHGTDRAGLDALPDGALWRQRDQYEHDTAWAPPYVGRQLRLARTAYLGARSQAAIAEAEAAAARRNGDELTASRHDQVAATASTAVRFLTGIIETDERLMLDWNEWSESTTSSRMTAVECDSLLRRRHPELEIAPLKSAEPEPVSEELPALDEQAVAEHVERVRAQREAFRQRMDERAGLRVPAEDPDYEDEGEAFPQWLPAEREAILQPPKPVLRPSSRIERESQAEA